MQDLSFQLFSLHFISHAGVNQATRNSMVSWSKQMLHVWVKDSASAKVVLRAFKSSAVEKELKSNTLVLVTVVDNTPEIFSNEPRQKCKSKK